MKKFICDICGEEIAKRPVEHSDMVTIALNGFIVKGFHTAAGYVKADSPELLHIHSKCFSKIRCVLSANSKCPETDDS